MKTLLPQMMKYGTFFSSLYKKCLESNNRSMVKKMFHFLSHIRKVKPEFRIQSYQIEIDLESFAKTNAKFDSKDKKLELLPSSTCKELYDLVKKIYNLNEYPFYITRTIYDKASKKANDVEIFNNNFPISK